MVKIALTGIPKLDLALAGLQTFYGVKSVNAAVRKAAKEGAKIVKDDAKNLINDDSGELSDSLTIRNVTNKQGVGAKVTTKEGMFKGATFYGGFIEYGWMHAKARRRIPEDSFLRRPLYTNKDQIRARYIKHLVMWLRLQDTRGGI